MTEETENYIYVVEEAGGEEEEDSSWKTKARDVEGLLSQER